MRHEHVYSLPHTVLTLRLLLLAQFAASTCVAPRVCAHVFMNRRFVFFEQEAYRVRALSALDVVGVVGGRGGLAAGDADGIIILADRQARCTGFQAHARRVNALAQPGGADALVSIGDGWDARPDFQRAAGRASALAGRARLRAEKNSEKETHAARDGAPDATERGAEEEDVGLDLGYLLKLGVPLEMPASSSLLSSPDDVVYAGYAPPSSASASAPGASASTSTGAYAASAAGAGGATMLGLKGVLSGSGVGGFRFGSHAMGSSGSGSASSSGLGGAVAASGGAELKVWRLDKRDQSANRPLCVTRLKLFGGPATKGLAERPISALAVSDDLTQIAFGCVDGLVVLLRGNFLSERGASSISAQVLYEGNPAFVNPATLSLPAWNSSFGGGSVPTHLTTASPDAVTFLAFTVPDTTSRGGDGDMRSNNSASRARSGVSDADDALVKYALSVSRGASRASSRRNSLLGGRMAAAGGGSAADAAAARAGRMMCLYSVWNSRVRSFYTTEVRPPGHGRSWSLADCSVELDPDMGAAPGCATLADNGDLLIGVEAGIFSFTHEDRSKAYKLPGMKQCISTLRHHMLVSAMDEQGKPAITVYDVRSKFVAFQLTLASPAVTAAAASMNAAAGGGLAGGGPPVLAGRAGLQQLAAAAAATAAPGAGNPAILSNMPFVFAFVKEWGQAFAFIQLPQGLAAAMVSTSVSGAVPESPFVYQLREKDTSTKVEHLCKLQAFETAANVARDSGYDEEHIAEIHREHGEFLYSQGDYDGAVAQYIETIGVVEPSYVIRRFLESQRIHNLTTYLEALHAKTKATSNHTTLLLNCYTKLRQTEKLRKFIKGELFSASEAGAHGELHFDVPTAIRALREVGCYTEAVYLAKKHGDHDAFLQTHIENAASLLEEGTGADKETFEVQAARYGATVALDYVQALPFDDAEKCIRRYGRALLAAIPDETTAVLSSLCIQFPAPGSSRGGGRGAPRLQERSDSPEEYISLFDHHPEYLRRFCSSLIQACNQNVLPSLPKTIWHTYVEMCLREDTFRDTLLHSRRSDVEEALTDTATFAKQLEVFRVKHVIEGVFKNPSAAFDIHHCLQLCVAHDFMQGCIQCYELMHMFDMVLQCYISLCDSYWEARRMDDYARTQSELLRKASAWLEHAPAGGMGSGGGSSRGRAADSTLPLSHMEEEMSAEPSFAPEPSLWVTLLKYFTRCYGCTPPFDAARDGETTPVPTPTPVSTNPFAVRASSVYGGSAGGRDGEPGAGPLREALRRVESYGLLPPLLVLSILAENSKIPFSMVRDYVSSRLDAVEAAITDDIRGIESLRTDTASYYTELERLSTTPVLFQQRKCAYCNTELVPPSLYFLCGGLVKEEHAFHLHCATATDSGYECPICAHSHKQSRDIQAERMAAAGTREQREQFYRELRHSEDGFLKVAEYLGKSVFDISPSKDKGDGASHTDLSY